MNSLNLTTIELSKEYLEFSAGHFTIFDATHREKMHGHNYNVHATIVAAIEKNGMAFDYMIYKQKVQELCKRLNAVFLLPAHSPYFKIEEQENCYIGHFNKEKIPFSKADILILPIVNVTIEELAKWFLQQLVSDKDAILEHHVYAMTIKVFSSPGVCASASWERSQ